MPLLSIALILATPQACPAEAEPIPSALAAWSAGTPIAAAAAPAQAPAVTLAQTARIALHPAAHLRLAPPPERAAKPDSHGGILSLDVAQAGTYRIALSDAAWVDMVRDGRALASTAHAHGPRCSGMRKVVDFALQPGRHRIQLSGSPTPDLRLLVAPAG